MKTSAVVVIALVLSACGGGGGRSVYVKYPSLRAAAAAISHHCAPRDVPSADSNGVLWLSGGRQPLVYYAPEFAGPPEEVFSSLGPTLEPWGEFMWPCRPPVVVHYPRTHTASRSSTALLTVLTSSPHQRKTSTLGLVRFAGGGPQNRNSLGGGGNAITAPNGRIIFFSENKIRYAVGPQWTVGGLPHDWQIEGLVVSPSNPSVFLADVVNTTPSQPKNPPCEASIYRIEATQSTRLQSYDPCSGGLEAEWSPNGRNIAWTSAPGSNRPGLSITDAYGRHRHILTSREIVGAVWSPDSTALAYAFDQHGRWTAVVNIRTGARHVITRGEPLAWSPDGKNLAILRDDVSPTTTIVAVPVTGGQPRLLFKIPPAKP
jgi:hypothetical protein